MEELRQYQKAALLSQKPRFMSKGGVFGLKTAILRGGVHTIAGGLKTKTDGVQEVENHTTFSSRVST